MMQIIYSDQADLRALRARIGELAPEVESAVAAILADVRENGDAALIRYAKRFDKADLDALTVTEEEIASAFKAIDPALLDVMRQSHENIRAYHARQKRQGFVVTEANGVVLGQRILPLERVGLYIPGGTASYPSTVLMNVVPAKIAGVEEIVITTPPQSDGSVSPAILVAARIAGADKIIKSGGAQAIAALAYGTSSVPRVDKITGPGNVYVATAKRMVYGLVDIDMIAGPSEILVIADETANPTFIAADLLSQAEHDALSAAILITPSEKLAYAVQGEVELQLGKLPREGIAAKSIRDFGRIVVCASLEEAACISNGVAPEHLELCVNEPFALLGKIRHAGSVFLGHYTPEALGDYFAGPNHTLPTNGTARFSSPLSVDDFIKKSSFIQYTGDALKAVRAQIEMFARAEGLEAHARSVSVRFEE